MEQQDSLQLPAGPSSNSPLRGGAFGSSRRAGRTTHALRHPFYSLPAELMLSIIDLLPPEAFINFAFANYPLLHNHGLAPELSAPRIVRLTAQTDLPALFPLLQLPPEITLHILGRLKPVDIMRFVLANYQDLARQGIAPPLTHETVTQLWDAVREDLSSPGECLTDREQGP